MTDKTKKALGDKIKKLRNSKNWNQEMLSEVSGVPLGTLRNIEQGRNWPISANLRAIAESLEVSEYELLDLGDKVKNDDSSVEERLKALESKAFTDISNNTKELEAELEDVRKLEKILGKGIIKTILESQTLLVLIKGILVDIPLNADQAVQADLEAPKKKGS